MTERDDHSHASPGVSTAVKVCYALPAVSMAMLWTPLNVMQGIYIKYYGLSMGVMAAILLASRIYDSLADLIVGALSDWRKSRTGRRKPLFAVGALVFATTAIFVYVPRRGVGPWYVTFWLFAFFTGYAMVMIPHLGWGAELASASRQKTVLFSMRGAAGYVGLCLFYAIPLLPIFATSEITPATIRLSVYLAVAILLPALILCLTAVPEGATTKTANTASVAAFENLRVLSANRPFRVLMSAYLLCGAGLGLWYGMIFIFVDIYLARGALFAPLYLVAFGVGIGSSLGWNFIAAKVGKKTAWSTGMVLALITVFATSFLTPQNAGVGSIGLIVIVNTVGFACFELLPESILGDVADYSLWKSGRNQAASYFAVYMFVTKLVFALGGAVGLGLAARLGFDPSMHEQTARGVLALHIVMAWLPSILLVAAIVLIQFIPMNERRHAVIRRRLDQRVVRGTC